MQIFASLRTRAKVEVEILSSSSECLVGNSSGVFFIDRNTLSIEALSHDFENFIQNSYLWFVTRHCFH